MWTLNMTRVSILFLLLVGWGQAAEDDVTPRLSFSYSKCTDTHSAHLLKVCKRADW